MVEIVGELTKAQLIEQIYEMAPRVSRDEYPQPNVTVREFREGIGASMTIDHARRVLNSLVGDGKMESALVCGEKIYWKVGG